MISNNIVRKKRVSKKTLKVIERSMDLVNVRIGGDGLLKPWAIFLVGTETILIG